jgi:HD-GYP domain-containing protein (c-di-GMP phosphodiesterase class II)
MLAGEQIPVEARIVSACDSWNAMRTDRSYRQALSYEAALRELVSCSGTQFDPRVLNALVLVVERDERPASPSSTPVDVSLSGSESDRVPGAPTPTRAMAC